MQIEPAIFQNGFNYGGAMRYVITNMLASLDAAGEWIIRDNYLKYVPRTDEIGKTSFIEVPILTKFMKIDGSDSSNKIKYFRFRGLAFHFASSTNFDYLYSNENQDAESHEAAIEVNHADSIAFENVDLMHVGTHGIWLNKDVTNSSVLNSHVADTGASGIRIGVKPLLKDELEPSGNTIKNNIIHATGMDFPGGGLGILVRYSHHNKIVQNVIADTTYSGISLGLGFDHKISKTHHNEVSGNYITNIMQKTMNDGGGIYLAAERSPGTVISGNIIKNVSRYPYSANGGSGIYFDERTSDVSVKNNWISNTHSNIFIFSGTSNTLTGNYIIGSNNGEGDIGFYINKECAMGAGDCTLITTQAQLLNNYIIPSTAEFIRFFDTSDNKADISYKNNYVKSSDISSINQKYCPNSSQCFQYADLSGNVNDAWARPTLLNGGNPVKLMLTTPLLDAAHMDQLMGSVVSPSTLWSTTEAPSKRYIQYDAKNDKPGAIPSVFEREDFNSQQGIQSKQPGSIRVAADGLGGQCAAFVDGPNLNVPWYPYVILDTYSDSDVNTISFDIKGQVGTNFTHEWRQYINGGWSHSGPKMTFSSEGGITIYEDENFTPIKIGNFPIGNYVHVDISSSNGFWNYKIKYADGKLISGSRRSPFNPGWQKANKLVFYSESEAPSQTCIKTLLFQ